jgi:5-formyltetrahydrofolate cyclo-ligase
MEAAKMKNEERQNLRKKILAGRNQLSQSEVTEKSRMAVKNILGLPAMENWTTLFVYVNFRSELETTALIYRLLDRGKRVAVPLVDAAAVRMIPFLINDPESELRPGYYDIPEPDPEKSVKVSPAEIDAAFIPGSVFDKQGGRLGYGGGYYDRFLQNEAPQAKRLGLAFEMQVVDKVPVLPMTRRLIC